MTPGAADSLRRSAAHVVVADVAVPVLSDDAAHHVFRVLRVRDGEVVSVTDGRGGWRLCRAVSGAIEPVTEVVVEEPSPSPVTIGFAIPKQDRPEWIVQKLTEIGVDRIMWGSDFPHEEGTYPHTREALAHTYGGIDPAEVSRMLSGNAAEVYGFDLAQLQAVADEIGPAVHAVHAGLDAIPESTTSFAFGPRTIGVA